MTTSIAKPYVLDTSLPAGARLTLFLEHFRALLPTALSSYTGQGGRHADSNFQVRLISGPLALGDGSTQQTAISLAFMPDGSLPNITAVAVAPVTADHLWHKAISEFFTRVLTSAFADRKQRYVRRVVLQYIGPALDGEYWFGGVRVAPAEADEKDRAVVNFERAIAVDAEVDAVDRAAADAIATFRASRLGAFLSLLTDVALYLPKDEALWVMPMGTRGPVRAHRGYQFLPSELPSMPAKGSLCQPGKGACSIFDTYSWVEHRFSLPREARSIIRTINGLDPSSHTSAAIETASRLVHVALQLSAISVSGSLAYRVAAVEALACRLRPAQKFSPFMREWVPPYPELESDLDLLYGQVRSGHLHAGTFLSGEYTDSGFTGTFFNPEEYQKWEIIAKVRKLTRLAIGKWLQSLPDPARRGQS